MEPTAVSVTLDLVSLLSGSGKPAAAAGAAKGKRGGGGASTAAASTAHLQYKGTSVITYTNTGQTMMEQAEARDLNNFVVDNTTLSFHASPPRVKIENIKCVSGKKSVPIASVKAASTDNEDTRVVTLGAPVCQSGYGSSCELHLDFVGHVAAPGEPLEGLYLIPACQIVTTFFEVSNARKCFPCIDAPSLRVTWGMNVLLPSAFESGVVLANTPESSRKVTTSGSGSVLRVGFEQTQAVLPAYVVGFMASSVAMKKVEGVGRQDSVGGAEIPVAVYAPTGSQYPVDLALRATTEAISLLSEFVQHPLPHTKMDAVVLPSMAIAGMEHDGMITLNEGTGVKKPGGITKNLDECVVQLCVHEVAHHWLGNMIGLPFAMKEGLCQVIEQCFGDEVQGKPMRTYKGPSTASGEKKAVSADGGGGIEVASGAELTGLTYQVAYNQLVAHVSTVGWSSLRDGLRRLVAEHEGTYASQSAVDAILFS